MLYALWSAKGGSGCTATAMAFASRCARTSGTGALLVDLGGDVTAAAGIVVPEHGLTDWLAAPTADDAALRRLEVAAGRSGLAVLSVGGATSWPAERAAVLERLLRHDPRPVVVDVGTVARTDASSLDLLRSRFAAAAGSLLVTRGCYLSMRHAGALGYRPAGIVLVRDAASGLDRHEVAGIVGAPVVAQIDVDPVVAKAIDAGRLLRRCPRPLARPIRELVS